LSTAIDAATNAEIAATVKIAVGIRGLEAFLDATVDSVTVKWLGRALRFDAYRFLGMLVSP
jgi:hypothetical protein